MKFEITETHKRKVEASNFKEALQKAKYGDIYLYPAFERVLKIRNGKKTLVRRYYYK